MTNIDPKTIKHIVTHADCPDGIASAMLCHDAIPEASITFVQYGTPAREQLEAVEGMLFVDMTPPEARVDEFVAAGAWVLDHHRGARELVARFGERGIFADEAESPGVAGANLAYQYVWKPWNDVFNEPLPTAPDISRFTKLAGIRDTWQKDDPLWDEACAQAAALTFFDDEYLIFGHPPYLLSEERRVGYRLIERREEAVKKAALNAYRCDIGAIFSDPDRLTSDVAEALRDEGVALTAGFFFPEPHVMVVSLRSDGSVDVAALVKPYGGGGHTRAAGFRRQLRGDDEQPFQLVERLLRKGLTPCEDW